MNQATLSINVACFFFLALLARQTKNWKNKSLNATEKTKQKMKWKIWICGQVCFRHITS